MNGDGIRDIVSGSWPGEIYIILGRKDGTFAAPETLKDSEGNEINLDRASVVTLNDWDRDGDLDMIVGTISGEVYFLANNGGSFGEAVALTANGETIKADHGGPALADWDGNGTVDLLIGQGNGQVRFFPNKNKKGMPDLGAGVVLVPAAEGSGGAPGMRAKIDVADWNGDGKLDLLLGDFHAEQGQAPDLTEADLKAKADAEAALKPINEKMREIYTKMTQDCLKQLGVEDMQALRGDKELMKKYSDLTRKAMEENKEFETLQAEMMPLMQTLTKFSAPSIRSGKVWVFLRRS